MFCKDDLARLAKIKGSFCRPVHRISVSCPQIIAFVRPLFAPVFTIVRESLIHQDDSLDRAALYTEPYLT
jgi:hypothetical protein